MKEIAVFSLLLIMYSISQAQIKTGFNIDGNVKELKNGSKLCMVIKRGNKIDTIARATTRNGVFTFKNVMLPVYPDFYLVCVQTEFVENLQLFLDQAGDVEITGELSKWPNVAVLGSKTHDDFKRACLIQKQVMDETFAIKYPGRTAVPDTILAYSKVGIETVMKQMPDSFYLPAMLATWTFTSPGRFPAPVSMKRLFYNKLSIAQKESYYGKILGKQIADYLIGLK